MTHRLIARIQLYLDHLQPAISGSGGHAQTFRVAKILVFGFHLSNLDALHFLQLYNQRCSPPWSEKELIHKISSARLSGPGYQKSLL